jgi:carbamoyl-phosphate synthase small subunit
VTEVAILALEDGTVFRGRSFGALGQSSGEVVFNTSMTGYQEIITDPSYARQIITFTYPHIGNTGINLEDMESSEIWSAGVIIRDLPLAASNWRMKQSLGAFLTEKKVVAIAEIDTRRLTRKLRDSGPLNGAILSGDSFIKLGEEGAIALAKEFPGLQGMDLAQHVTARSPYEWSIGEWNLKEGFSSITKAKYKVVAYDFGVKHNILRMLSERDCEVIVVPATTSAEEVLAMSPDGIFLSNGPGDPEPCDYAIEAIKVFLEKKVPVFGICLGYQLLAIACGARTLKMGLGHHGGNHPVQSLRDRRVFITSQNHGFAVNPDTLPANLEVTFKSLFDDSLQGFECKDSPAFGFQGHPEASPGPQDIDFLFEHFIELICDNSALNTNKRVTS